MTIIPGQLCKVVEESGKLFVFSSINASNPTVLSKNTIILFVRVLASRERAKEKEPMPTSSPRKNYDLDDFYVFEFLGPNGRLLLCGTYGGDGKRLPTGIERVST